MCFDRDGGAILGKADEANPGTGQDSIRTIYHLPPMLAAPIAVAGDFSIHDLSPTCQATRKSATGPFCDRHRQALADDSVPK